MTLHRVDNVWLSDRPETDCKECGLRYFTECSGCKRLVCNWCCCGDDIKVTLCEPCDNTKPKVDKKPEPKIIIREWKPDVLGDAY